MKEKYSNEISSKTKMSRETSPLTQQLDKDKISLNKERRCWKIDFYKVYFDVDTEDIIERCRRAVWPLGIPIF